MATVAFDCGHDVSETHYEYGDQNMDYGYGDPDNNADNGENTAEPSNMTDSAKPARRPRRRCSVTKYSLEETAQAGSAEAEMVKNLHAAEMMQKFRQGL